MTVVIKRPRTPLWQRLLPFMAWLPKVSGQTLQADLIAGITVALVAIPQSLAYAQLAGVPPYYGLYASFLPVIVGALWGSSPALSTGPVAMTSLLTAASVMTLAKFGTDQFYAYVILMALLSGLFQIILGVARMGVLINFLSYPVLRGFINAAAIIIALAQLPAMLGLKLEHSAHFMLDVLHVIEHSGNTHLMSLAFGLAALIMLFLIRKFFPRLPGVLIVVAITTLVSYLAGFEADGGTVVGAIPKGLPSFSMPPVDPVASMKMLPAAFIIAIISFMEAMSSSKIIAIKKRIKWDENQELIGQGLAKVAAAFSTGMPVSGSFSRSALNLASGAQTGLASVFSAVIVLITLFFFTPLLYHLPKPVLAAIIMMAVFGLIDVQVIKEAWRANRQDGIAAIVTFVATLAFAPNIQNGILTGILLSLVLYLFRTMRPAVVTLGVDEKGVLRSAKRYNLPKLHPQITAVRFDGELYFANVSYFEEAVLYLVGEDKDLKEILVVGDGINEVDASGVEMLRNLVERLHNSGVGISFANVKDNVLEVFKNTGLCELVGDENVYPSVSLALEGLKRKLETSGAEAAAETGAEEAVAQPTPEISVEKTEEEKADVIPGAGWGKTTFRRRTRYALLYGAIVIALAVFGWFNGRSGNTPSEEFQLIRQQAEQGDAGNELLYGLALMEGRYGLPPDPGKGLPWVRRAAEDGDAYAALIMGNAYSEGKGVAKDPARAAKWWRKAADKEVEEAAYRLGQAYASGRGVPKDSGQAVRWLREAAEAGYPKAQYALGRLHLEGAGVRRDTDTARQWLRRAAANGHREAVHLLRALESLVRASTPLSRESGEALKRRAMANDPHAQYELAMRYESGAFSVNRDPRQALLWLRKAADNGNVLAMRRLARAWERGELGLKADPAKAAAWRKRAHAAASPPSR